MGFFIVLFIAMVIFGGYGLVTGNHPTMKSLRSVPVLNAVEAKKQGYADMRKAVESEIVQMDYVSSRQSIEDEHALRMKARYNNDSASRYTQMSDSSMTMSKADALEALDMKYKRAKRKVGSIEMDTVAGFMVKWETSTNEVFPFDPAKGQTGEYYFGADGKIYDAYISGGMDYLNELNQTKYRVIDRTSTVNTRKSIQTQVNRQWKAANDAQHMLQIESMTSAHEKYNADMQKIVDASKMIEKE